MSRNRPVEFTVPLAGAIGVDACKYYSEMASAPQEVSAEESALQAMIKAQHIRAPPSSADAARRPRPEESKEETLSLPGRLDLSSLSGKPWRVGMKAGTKAHQMSSPHKSIEPHRELRAPTDDVCLQFCSLQSLLHTRRSF